MTTRHRGRFRIAHRYGGTFSPLEIEKCELLPQRDSINVQNGFYGWGAVEQWHNGSSFFRRTSFKDNRGKARNKKPTRSFREARRMKRMAGHTES